MPIVTSRGPSSLAPWPTSFAVNLSDPVRVYDGPVAATDTMWTQAVFVGFDGDWHTTPAGDSTGGPYEVMLGNQELTYVGNTSNREELEIHCCAAIWTGEPDLQPALESAFNLFGAVQQIVRSDPTLGIDGSTIATVQTFTAVYDYDTAGNVGAAVRFTVHVLTTLLTT